MLTRRERSHFYLWARGRDEAMPRLWPNVSVFAEGIESQTFYLQMVAVTGRLWEMFNRVSGLYPVDAVFTSRAGAVPALMLGLATSAEHPVPVVLLEPHVYAPGTMSHNEVTELDAGCRALGYAMALCAYFSTWERDEGLQCVSLWLSPAALKRAEENAFVLPYVVDVPSNALDVRGVVDARQPDLKRLLFCGRLNTNKRFPEVLQAYAKVLQTRGDVEVWVHAGTGAIHKLDPKDSRWHRTSERLPLREQYHRLLAGANVGAYASLDEGVNATVLEMLAWGIVLALPRKPWVEKLFWPQAYPFVYESLKELPVLLDWLLDHEEEARQTLTPIRELIAARHSQEAWKAGWGRLFDAVDEWNEWNERNAVAPSRKFREVTEQLMSTRSSVPFATALEIWWGKMNAWFRRTGGVDTGGLSVYAAYLAVREWDDYRFASPQLAVRPVREVTAVPA